MGSELLLEGLRAYLRRRLRRRLCNGSSWTGGTLGFIVADCAFVSEPYAWMVYALAAFLDDVPLKPTKTLKSGMGNWITQAFGVLSHSTNRPRLPAQDDDANWIATTFFDAPSASFSSSDPPANPRPEGNWIASAFFSALLSEVVDVGEDIVPGNNVDFASGGWMAEALLEATQER
eukprot:symbB.v1.2.006347.t1/scaffold374.1/size218025/8